MDEFMNNTIRKVVIDNIKYTFLQKVVKVIHYLLTVWCYFEIIKFFFDTLHENTIKTQKKLGFIWLFIVSLKIHLITIDESIDKRTVMLSFLSINYFVKLSFVRSFHRYPLVLTISPPLYRDQRWLENKCYISLPFT